MDLDKIQKYFTDAKTELSRYFWSINYSKITNLYHDGIKEYYKYIIVYNDTKHKHDFLNVCIEAFDIYIKQHKKIHSYCLHQDMIEIIKKYLNICNDLHIPCIDKIEHFINTEKYANDMKIEEKYLLNLYELLAENHKINKNYNKAIQYYEKIIVMYKILNLDTSIHKYRNEIIKINILNNDYISASSNYKENAKLEFKKDLLILNGYHSLSTSIIMIIDLINEEQLQEMIDEYKTTYPNYENSGSYEKLIYFLHVYKNRDVEELKKLVKTMFIKIEEQDKINNLIKQLTRSE